MDTPTAKPWEQPGADPDALGLVHIYTGDGKGKTTAAVGLACRALGRGLRVTFVQFMKDDTSGELDMLRRLGATVISGLPHRGFTWELTEAATANLRAQCAERLRQTEGLAGETDVLILDEIIGATTFGYADESDLLRLIDTRPPHTELVLTGREPSDALIGRADYLIEMCLRKHPFVDRGLDARAGIEY